MSTKADPLALKSLELVQATLNEAEEKAIARARRLIKTNELSPDIALQILCEIDALRGIPDNLKRMQRRAAIRNSSQDVDN